MGRKSRKKRQRRSKQRVCGDCKECCTSLGVNSAVAAPCDSLVEYAMNLLNPRIFMWSKPHRETSEIVTENRCGVYDEHPAACHEFQ